MFNRALKYDILTPEEKQVFTNPVEDDWEQEQRECAVLDRIYENKECPLKGELVFWLNQHEYDYAVSSAQYHAAKTYVSAYNKTHEQDLLKTHILNNDNKSI